MNNCPWCKSVELETNNQFIVTWSCGSNETESGEPQQSDECIYLVLLAKYNETVDLAKQLYFKVKDFNPNDYGAKILHKKHTWLSMIEEGDSCPFCFGTMGFEQVEGCTCHTSPPCHRCVTNPLVCPECYWSYDNA